MNDTPHMREQKTEGIASSVLSRIEAEHVVPTPRSHFVFRERVVWGLGAFSIVMGSLGVAALLFTARYSEWEFYETTHDTFLTFMIEIMPYAWLFALIVFIVVAYESIKHTKRGYRYSIPTLALMTVGASVVGGTVLSLLGGGQFADRIASYVPPYHSHDERLLRIWNKPERGLIAGMVTEVSRDGSEFTLRSPTNVLHTIRTDYLDDTLKSDITVGTMMRVMAPLTERAPVATTDENSASASLMMEAESNDVATDITTELATDVVADGADVAETALFMAETPAPDERRAKFAPGRDPEEREEKRPAYFREACVVIPLREFTTREERRKKISECAQTLREARAAQRPTR